MRWVFALAIAAGCYRPAPSPGAPCAPGGVCPTGLTCIADLCVLPGSGPTDGPSGDAPEDDAPPTDGPPPVNGTGCSDGQREGFLDPDEFPTIAGCKASWSSLKNLRADKRQRVRRRSRELRPTRRCV